MTGDRRSRAPAGRHLPVSLIVTALLIAVLVTDAGERSPTPLTGPAIPRAPVRVAPETAPARRANLARSESEPPLAVPAALTDADLSLRDGPVAVPLRLRMPSLGVDAPVMGVGMTATDVMDAPMGPAEDPSWQQAFWYRGSAVPGEPSTALIAGHIDDPLGRPAVFGHIDQLRPGDPLVVHDTRSQLDVTFEVTGSTTYSLDETTDPAVLAEIYGAGPVEGTWPQPSSDGLAHLTLITCAGTFRNGTHDHRLVVFATRTAG